MELGMIGLGRMGGNMVRRLLGGGYRVVVYDPVKEAIPAVVERGAVAADSITRLVQELACPRVVWIMVPSGEPTEDTVNALAAGLSPGDIVIDGGNSNYKDSMQRAASLAGKDLEEIYMQYMGGLIAPVAA